MREFDLLHRIYAGNASLPPSVTIPPGDDMGAVRVGESEVLVTVDQVADGTHFDLRQHAIEKIGRKAITRNLSDVAAMGAVPVGAVAAGCLPRDFGAARAQQLFDAMRATANQYECPLFGGDIGMWDHPLILTVTVLAKMAGLPPLLRKGARVGDVVCVTGRLGGSVETVQGYTRHLDFEPRLRVGRALASHAEFRPHCMIDLSDGLAKDAGHLCRAASVAVVLDAERLPLSAGAIAASQRDGLPVWRHAVGDGEDYELCFTLDPQQAEKLAAQGIAGAEVSVVGTVVAYQGGARVSVRTADGVLHPIDELGWEHRGP